MRNKEVISFLGLWETIHNENFKGANSLRLKMRLVVINLNKSARRQMSALKDNKGIKDLELLQQQIENQEQKLISNNNV